MAAALGGSGWAGTTVAATLIAASAVGIHVFATGGIGGVHRGGESSMDISADLAEIGRAPVAVVCAGPKAILDVPTDAGSARDAGGAGRRLGHGRGARLLQPDERAPRTVAVDGAAEAAALFATATCPGIRWRAPFSACRSKETGTSPFRGRRGDRAGHPRVEAAGIHGPASTPWVLDRVATITAARRSVPTSR